MRHRKKKLSGCNKKNVMRHRKKKFTPGNDWNFKRFNVCLWKLNEKEPNTTKLFFFVGRYSQLNTFRTYFELIKDWILIVNNQPNIIRNENNKLNFILTTFYTKIFIEKLAFY